MLRKFLSEPLAHFFIIGIALFGLDQAIALRSQPPMQIIVDQSVYADLSDMFEGTHGRLPTHAELMPLVDTWVYNEVLYRQAKAMKLDQGDDVVRARLQQKLRMIIAGTVDVPAPSQMDLQQWFEKYRDGYDTPARYSFDFGRANNAAEAERRADALNTQGPEPAAVAQILNYVNRPETNILQLLGVKGLNALQDADIGRWMVLENKNGAAVIRLNDRQVAQRARFEDVEQDVRQRWENWANKRAARDQITALKNQYEIVMMEVDPTLVRQGYVTEPNVNR